MTHRGPKFGPEDLEQIKLINWARHTARLQPDPVKRQALEFFHHIPSGGGRGKPFITRNGTKLPPLEAVKFKALGTTPGITDLRLDYVVRVAGIITYPGLVGEMKEAGKDLRPEQKFYQDFMKSQGFAVSTWYCWWLGALDVAHYMDLEEFSPVLVEGEKKVIIVRNREQLERWLLAK